MGQIKDKLTKIPMAKNKEFLEQFIAIYQKISSSLTNLKKFNLRYKAVFFFEDWINEEKIQFPRRLCMYLEEHVVRGLDGAQCMRNFRELFKFLKEKDMFEKIYRRDYAVRMVYCAGNE